MSNPLPSLRNDIEVMPSPDPGQPGLLIRDPYRYSDSMLIIPPVLAHALAFLDGEKTALDLQAYLTRHIGQAVPLAVVDDLVHALDDHGFLQSEKFHRRRDVALAQFRDSVERSSAHAGAAYSLEPEEIQMQLAEFMLAAGAGNHRTKLSGIAAPHVSFVGGSRSYASAYGRLFPELSDKTFVLLGTSHYGQPEKFGLTRKPFVTPLGKLECDIPLVDWLAARAGDSVVMEDYCHSIEHSIEFQCLFLQHTLGTGCRILPILCGPFLDCLLNGEKPEAHDDNRRFFDALGELAEREGQRLFWILGIDLAHIGKRYGDPFAVHAGRGRMAEVRQKDHVRLERICTGDREGFLDLVQPQGDELRWCGFSPLYTYLKAVPEARGSLLSYEQWNIDGDSVVTVAALEFFRPE